MAEKKTGYLEEDRGGLCWGRLVRGTLERRYRRFLADVRLGNNRRVTAHVPNTGSMLECSEPGRPVWLSRHDDPKRKLKYTWELIDMPGGLVGVNTVVPNRLVGAAAAQGLIKDFQGYDRIRGEVKTNDHTRLDFLLEGDGRRPCYVEIKNCTLVRQGKACFPDAVTTRGRKHLFELLRLVEEGARGVIFYLVQRMDAEVFSPADHIDPEYGQTLREVVDHGVEALAWDVAINLDRIDLNRPLPIKL